MSVNSPFQSASTIGQGTHGQAQSYGPSTMGQQARPQDIWDDLGLGSPQQAAQTVQQVGQVIKTISEIAGMFNASPGGQQPGMAGQDGQQQTRPQDIWDAIGSAFGSAGQAVSSAAPDVLRVAKQVAPYLPIVLALASASPGGQQSGMAGQDGQQQTRPQDIWDAIGSAFGSAGQAVSSAAPDVLRVAKQVAPYLPIVLALASASPGGQQSGMAGQDGQQQTRPQDIWDDLGLGSPQQAAQTVQQVGQVIKTISEIAGMFNASPGGQQPGMAGQYGRQY
ncbi:hypothetical protein [Streptomyces sp. P9-A2]|uniref:hypothetical protein n=1 Tax=Streptomyces sp. P9-A2 TaxID=3072284 RepID=UPI002FC9DDC9